MIKSRKFFVVLVMTTLGLTTGASLVEADPPANAPWSFEAIAGIPGGDVGKHTSIAFSEGNGKPYISYYDETNGDLRLIYPHATAGNCGPNNEWYCEAVDTGGDVGQYSSIDYFHNDATGANKIGIAYFDATNETLKVAIWSSSGFPLGWTVSIVDGGFSWPLNQKAGRHASLKFDSVGAAHIAYTSRNSFMGNTTESLNYAYPVTAGGTCGQDSAAGKWQCGFVRGSAGWDDLGAGLSLNLNGVDEPLIALMHMEWEWLELCERNLDTWSCRTIEDGVGGTVSLAIDQSNQPHIGYYDRDNGKLKYATYVGTDGNCGLDGGVYLYQCDTIDTIGDGQSQVGISIAVDLEGYPIIAYQEDSDPMGFPYLNVARPAFAHGSLTGNCGPIVNLFRRWQCTTIDDATQGGGAGSLYEADFTAVGVAPNGLASIAYYEIDGYNNEGRLKFAAQEIPGLLFGDGFETGNTYAWAEVVGGQ